MLQISHTADGNPAGVYISSSTGQDASAFADGRLMFDIKVVSGDSNITAKLDCFYPCTSGALDLGSKGASGWETVTIPFSTLIAGGLDISNIDTGLVIWATNATSTVFRLDNVRWEVGEDNTVGTDGGTSDGGTSDGGASDGGTSTVALPVYQQGQVDSIWDNGINAFDAAIGWGECNNDGGAACPSMNWGVVTDGSRGDVLQIAHSATGDFAGMFISSSSGQNASEYAAGNLVFDIKVISGDSNISIKLDCFYPCTSGDQDLGSRGVAGWETVSVPFSALAAGGLDLTSINTGLVIWATNVTSTVFQIDNVRWEVESSTGGTDGGGTTDGGLDGGNN